MKIWRPALFSQHATQMRVGKNTLTIEVVA